MQGIYLNQVAEQLEFLKHIKQLPSPLRGEGWGEGERNKVGLEANPNASCGRKVSFTNASKSGRLRRTVAAR